MARVSDSAPRLSRQLTRSRCVSPWRLHDLRVRVQLDVRVALDAPDQVAGHAVGQAGRARQHMHARGCLRQEDGRLSRGVAAADDHDLLVPAQLRFHGRGAVVDAGPFEAGHVGDRQLPVLGARGDDDGARRTRASVVDLQHVRVAVARQSVAPRAMATTGANFSACV